MLGELKKIRIQFSEELAKTQASSLEDLELRFLGRKGIIAALTKTLKTHSQDNKAIVGKELNALKHFIEREIKERRITKQESRITEESFDVTLPGKKVHRGHLHPLTQIQDEMTRIFTSLNFSVVEGSEVETEHYNFDALNIPQNHPARDMWDTFWIRDSKSESKVQSPKSKVKEKFLLRTHTSPMQIRFMETHQPPLRIIVPGRVFRYEASDATHNFEFYQLEGLMVDKHISTAHFKAIMEAFFRKLFGKEFGGIRLRPSYFPFTEPSFEVDFYWKKKEKWLEIMGAGMVHPNVFKAAGFASGEWQGFAFGMGVDRVAMMKYKIPDIRLLYSGDLRFIRQF